MDVTYHGEEAYASGEGAILVTPEAGVEGERPVADAASHRWQHPCRGRGHDRDRCRSSAGVSAPGAGSERSADPWPWGGRRGRGPGPDRSTGAALESGVSVALVEQPYRVAGKGSSPAATRLDPAWTAVVEELRSGELQDLALIVGGRSAGARVACRTAAETGAAGVLCLAFPLQPPQRKSGAASPSRLPELDAVEVPMLIVQGEGDRFVIPPAGEPLARARRRRPQPAQGPRGGGGGGARVAAERRRRPGTAMSFALAGGLIFETTEAKET